MTESDELKALPNVSSASMEDGPSEEIQLYPVAQPYKLGPLRIPNYYNPYTQVTLAGFVVFLSVGMFGVLSDLGGGGQVDPIIADDANIILYSIFAATALFSGSIINYFGPKKCLVVGSAGYAMYGAAFWSYNHNKNKGFVLFGGAACGFGAGLLWTSCAVVMLSYPTEAQKGRFVAILFSIFYMGAVVGGCIPMAQNFQDTSRGSVSDGTYAALTILMAISSIVAIFIVDPKHIIRTDGTKVEIKTDHNLVQELKNIWWAFKKEKWVIFFIPYSFASLYYGAYQGSDFETYFFDVRTRSLDGFLISIAQVLASIIFGVFLDWKIMRRKTRAIAGWAILLFTVLVVSICGYFAMLKSHRGVVYDPPMDVTGGRLPSEFIALEFFYGFQDGLDNALAFWILGSLSNDPRLVSMYTAFYKVFGATGSAVAFGQDIHFVSYTAMYGSYWGVILFGVLFMVPLVFIRVKNTELTIEDAGEVTASDITGSDVPAESYANDK